MTEADRTHASDRIATNPFYVLAVSPECSRMEIEREGQKLLAMLDLDIAGAHAYDTPFGPRVRTHELVRDSMSELRDPQRRLAHELWARLAVMRASSPRDTSELARPAAWPDAFAALGWRKR